MVSRTDRVALWLASFGEPTAELRDWWAEVARKKGAVVTAPSLVLGGGYRSRTDDLLNANQVL